MGKDGVFGQHETAEYKFLLMRVSLGDISLFRSLFLFCPPLYSCELVSLMCISILLIVPLSPTRGMIRFSAVLPCIFLFM